MDSIPSKVGSFNRNILPGLTCQPCGHQEDNSDDILINCQVTQRIWSVGAIWCKLHVFTAHSTKELLNMLEGWPSQPEMKKTCFSHDHNHILVHLENMQR